MENIENIIIRDFDISKITWFRTGGLVKLFAVVKNKQELKDTILYFKKNFILSEVLKKNQKKYCYDDVYIVGNCSNILIRDEGFDGLIIKMEGDFLNINILDNQIQSGSGVLSVNLAQFCTNKNIKNLEFFTTIPGTVGGNIFMNAGCYNGEVSDVITKIEYFDKVKEDFFILKKEEINFQERNSNLSRNIIIVNGYFQIEYGDINEISAKVDKMKKSRLATQPVGVKTCGSTFVNPKNFKSWELIDQVGLRGFAIGGAKFSEKHSNFIVNFNNAKSKDIEDLINLAKERIKDKFNIDIKTEIEIL